MSGAVTPARRLLALLEEEPSLEARPRDDVAADLAALGIDPAGPILLARRLAERNSGPAATLLGAVIEDEAAEAEIAALESADIDDVRSRLPIGTVAAVTAEARRRAGAPSNVVGIARHRRGAFWAWTGSLVGMAAGVLIVAVAWWPPSEMLERPQIAEAELAAPDVAEMRAGRSEPAPRMAEPAPSSSPAAAPVVAMEAPRPEPEAAALGDEPEPSPVQSLIVTRPTIQESIDPARSVEADDSLESVTAIVPQPATSPVAGAGNAAADPIVDNLAEQGPDASALGDLSATPPPERTPPVSRIAREPVAPPLPTPAERRPPVRGLAVAPPAAADESPDLADLSARFRVDPLQLPAGESEDFSRRLMGDITPPATAAAETSSAAAGNEVAAEPPQESALPDRPTLRESVAPPLPPPTPSERRALVGDLAAEPSTEVMSEDTAGARSNVETRMPDALMDALSGAGREREREAGAGVRGLHVEVVPPDMAQAEPAIGAVRITAYLVVDPRVAPPRTSDPGLAAVLERVDRMSEGDLPQRLAEARRAAAGRHIVALAGLQGPEGAYEVVIVLRDPVSGAPVGEKLDPLLTMLLYGDRAEVFEQIRLPPE